MSNIVSYDLIVNKYVSDVLAHTSKKVSKRDIKYIRRDYESLFHFIKKHHLMDSKLNKLLFKLKDDLIDLPSHSEQVRELINLINQLIQKKVSNKLLSENADKYSIHFSDFVKDLRGYLTVDKKLGFVDSFKEGTITEEEFFNKLIAHRKKNIFSFFNGFSNNKMISLKDMELIKSDLQNKIKTMNDKYEKLYAEFNSFSFDDSKKIEDLQSTLGIVAIKLKAVIGDYEHKIKLLDSYRAHFLRESKWRIIDALYHIYKGRIFFFGKALSGSWVWVINGDNALILGARNSLFKGGFGSILPHSTLAALETPLRKGEYSHKVYAAGELLAKDGFITLFNAKTGHYFDYSDHSAFNNQVNKLFLLILKEIGSDSKPRFVGSASLE